MFQGVIATQVRKSNLRITDVRVPPLPDPIRFGPGNRFNPHLVLNQFLLVPEGPAAASSGPTDSSRPLAGLARTIPLSAIAREHRRRTPEEQWRENQQPAIFVTAELNEKEAGLRSVVADIRNWMKDIPMPSGYRWEMGGHYLRQQEPSTACSSS